MPFVQALQYQQRIQDAVPHDSTFQPLMTCYLTDATSADDVYEAKNNGVVAFKLYPAGATTNSSCGVTNFQKVIPTLKAMADVSAHENTSPTHVCFVCSLACMFVSGVESTGTLSVYNLNYLSIPLPQYCDHASLTPYCSSCSSYSNELHLLQLCLKACKGSSASADSSVLTILASTM